MIALFKDIQWYAPWFFPVFVFLFGACVGSFLNVVIYRLPAGKSVVKPGSMCSCGKPIKWYDNIPILSWFVLRGRARCCGKRFSFRYPLVEFGTALLFVGVWLTHRPLESIAVIVAFGLFIPAALIDFDTMEIPDRFTIGGFVLGVVLSAAIPSLHGYSEESFVIESFRAGLFSVVSGLVGSSMLLWIAILIGEALGKEVVGFGDVKLMAAIGAFFGWQCAVFTVFGGAVVGLLLFFPIHLKGAHEESSADVGKDDEDTPVGAFPFGPSLILAAMVYVLFLHGIVDAYFTKVSPF
jgi:leader peptidase (prepilin peptidase)/N-methyltransferase